MALEHGGQGFLGTRQVAALLLQLGMGEGDDQFRVGLAVQRLLQQGVAFFVITQVLGGARGGQVVGQGMRILLGGQAQVLQRRSPAPFGQFEQAAIAGLVAAPLLMAPRPGVEKCARNAQQTQQAARQPDQQPERQEDGQEHPQAGFVAQPPIGDQHVAAAFGDASNQQARARHQQNEQQRGTDHCASSGSAGGCSPRACCRWWR